jgi:hypothetical protein
MNTITPRVIALIATAAAPKATRGVDVSWRRMVISFVPFLLIYRFAAGRLTNCVSMSTRHIVFGDGRLISGLSEARGRSGVEFQAMKFSPRGAR